jgi:hypothetical protein
MLEEQVHNKMSRRVAISSGYLLLAIACTKEPNQTHAAERAAATSPVASDAGAPVALQVNSTLPLVLAAGGTAFLDFTVSRAVGFRDAIGLNIPDLPLGVTCTQASVPADPDGSGIGIELEITLTSDSTGSPIDLTTVHLVATSGTLVVSVPVGLTLTALSLQPLAPSLAIGQGQSVSFGVETAVLSDVAGPQTLSLSGLPAGVTADDVHLAADQTFALVSLSAAADAPVAIAAATLTLAVGDLTTTASLLVSVELNELTISVAPVALSIAPGADATLAVGVVRTGSFRTLSVPITLAGLPPGVTADPLFLSDREGRGDLRLRAGSSAALAGSSATVRAGGLPDPCSFDCQVLAQAPLSVNVVAPFAVVLSSSLASVETGGSVTVPFTVQRSGGFTGPITLAVTGPPSSLTIPELIVPAAATSGALSISAASELAACTTYLSISATGGALRLSLLLALKTFAPGGDAPFIAAFSPASAVVFAGDRATLTAAFDGDSASIDGLGAVTSGVAVSTGPIGRPTRFTLRVRRGSREVEATTSVAPAYRDRLRVLAPAPVARTKHLAAAVPGGALLMGGASSEFPNIGDSDSTALFDSAAETFAPGPQLLFSALDEELTTLAVLADGRLLLASAGFSSGLTSILRSQLYDPARRAFAGEGDLHAAPSNAITVALADGAALRSGGNFPPTSSAERWDANSGQWRLIAPMSSGRTGHTATLLQDGRVLVVGGLAVVVAGNTADLEATASAEIFDPRDDSFTPAAPLATGRMLHTATLLADGRVLVAGGFTGNFSGAATTAELFDPATGVFSPIAAATAPRAGHAALLLGDGRVLLAGGSDPADPASLPLSATEIFDPASGQLSPGPPWTAAFANATFTLLDNGKVLFFGGETPDEFPVAQAALFE